MLGNNIAKIRKEKHITQEQLANAIGIDRTALSRIENGAWYPRAKTMKLISDYLHMPIGDIFFNPDVLLNYTTDTSINDV